MDMNTGGLVRPRVLGLEETGTMKTGGYQTTAGAGNKRKQDNLDGVPAACSDMVEGRSQKDIVGMRTQDRGWGRTFDWDLLFKSLKVKLCWEEWEKLKWLRWEDQTKDTNKQTHKQNKLAKNTNTCSSSNGNTNSSSNNNNNSSSRQQPPSLFSLLEEDVSEVQGEGERNMDSEGEEQRRNEEDRNNAHANDRQGIEQENNETEKARQTSNQQDERRPWEADGLRSCIRFVTSVSPQQLLQMPACTQVDISSPPPKKNQHSLTTAKAEGETNDGVPAATDEQKDKRKARTCTSVPAGEGGSSASTPASASAAAAAAAAAATAAAATAATAGGGDGGGGVCNDREHIATVEFQRMWPVFVRIGEESRLPVNGDEEGVVLFLGCLLEVFHMRVNTQKEFSLCLRGIAEAAKADNNSSQVMQPQDLHTHAENKKNDNGGSSNNSSNSSNIYSSSQLADKAAPTASPSLLPPAQSARGREAENNTSDAPNNTMQTSARLHSDGDDNNDAEKQEEEAYEDSRVLPKILFEPAPKRAQLVFSASSSLGAAETNLRRTSGGLEAECLTKEREAEGECVDNDSKAKASHSPTAAPVYLAPEDSSYVDGGQLTRRKPAGNAKEKESSGQGAAEAVLQLQGRDGFQEMKGESRVDKSKANSPCLKVERSSASNTAGGESGYRLLHVSVPSYDRKGVQNTASIQMPQTMQTNTTSPCSTSLGGKAFANAREAQSGNNLQGWGYGVQAWTGQESGPQAEYKLYLKRRLEAVIRGVWSWRSESVSDFSQYHDEPFSASVARNAIRDGFTPYVLMHYASTTGAEERLKPLDMSVGGRRNIPFSGFSQELIDSLCSGIGHGMMYYSVVPGSVFPIHCEQGGLGAFNIVIGALMSYTESLCL
ncbi:hypothetical protein, conserved [Eimeria praecox]|uniref:Uncharacterized protein n=1 Tax=Eimeria praecox TaxID=51316 RepID=U6H007_9EIME|nr:hypothetical protein, conserved [Eimeria praecox]